MDLYLRTGSTKNYCQIIVRSRCKEESSPASPGDIRTVYQFWKGIWHTIDPTYLWKALSRQGILQDFISILAEMYTGTTASIKLDKNGPLFD